MAFSGRANSCHHCFGRLLFPSLPANATAPTAGCPDDAGPTVAKQQTNSNVQQTSTGEGSPNVQGVQGDVAITVDQSSGKTEAQKPPASKPKQENK
jgi:hypothetical protein